MNTKLILAAGLLCVTSTTTVAQQSNPREGWQDSYAVDGRFYCNSNFDHAINNVRWNTPVGQRTVPQICDDIRDKFGTGRSNGRIPYNTVACGHQPYNNAADEAGCPGRVDIGYQGCDQIGPNWDLDAVYSDDTPNEPVLDIDSDTVFEDCLLYTSPSPRDS